MAGGGGGGGGGSGSGLVSPLTTKGDLWSFSALNARFPVGSDDQVPVADHNQPVGMRWAAQLHSPLTTKGDLWAFGSDNARLPIGTDGQILVADSAQAIGVRWATGSGTTDPTAWHKTGDSFGAEAKLGTMDAQDLVLYSRGDACMRFNFNGNHFQGGPLLNGCVTTNMDEGIDIPFKARFRAYVDSGDNAFTGMGMGTDARPNTVFFGGFEAGGLYRRADALSFWASDDVNTSSPVEVMLVKQGVVSPPTDGASSLGSVSKRWNSLWVAGSGILGNGLTIGTNTPETNEGSAIFGRTGHEKLHFYDSMTETLLELIGDADKYAVLHIQSVGSEHGAQIRLRNNGNNNANLFFADTDFVETYAGKAGFLTISGTSGQGIRCNVNAANDSGWSIDANGYMTINAVRQSFYGGTPIAKQTGVPVTTDGIHAALVNLNLFSP